MGSLCLATLNVACFATPEIVVGMMCYPVHDVGDPALTLPLCTLLPEFASTLQETWAEKRRLPSYIVWNLWLPDRQGGKGEQACAGGEERPR